MAKRERTLMEKLLADQQRAVRPPKPRQASGPRPTLQCCTCNEVSSSVKAADRHVDSARHYRYKQVLDGMPH